MGSRNEAKDTRYKEKMVVWDEFQVALDLSKKRNEDPPLKPIDPHSTADPPKQLTQKPRKPSWKDVESPMIQCICSTAQCV